MSKRSLFIRVISGDNACWSVVKMWDKLWLAAAPDDSDYPERHFDDRRFYTYKEAIAYAIEQADLDATQERLV